MIAPCSGHRILSNRSTGLLCIFRQIFSKLSIFYGAIGTNVFSCKSTLAWKNTKKKLIIVLKNWAIVISIEIVRFPRLLVGQLLCSGVEKYLYLDKNPVKLLSILFSVVAKSIVNFVHLNRCFRFSCKIIF